jgi:hypothetical protein
MYLHRFSYQLDFWRTACCQEVDDVHARVDFSFFPPERSAVVRHHSAGPFGLTRVAIGPRSREFLDSVHSFLAQGRRLACDACLAQPFDVGHSSIERVNKLA